MGYLAGRAHQERMMGAKALDPRIAYRECVEGLAAFVSGIGFSDVVIGLSGGIDSSLVAVMAVDALGADRVHGVLLPGPFSSTGSVEDALELASALRIEALTMPIDAAYEAVRVGFAAACGTELAGLAAENAQARLRMVCLMALSNQFGWLMLNTGNRSEAAMGYSTLYGDAAGAFAPIGGLYKTEVYQLARWRNAHAEQEGVRAPIPRSSIEKPPSAELAEGQSDEAAMGIAYADLDAILMALEEGAESAVSSMESGFDEEAVEMVRRRFAATAFKRAQEPPFADVSRF